MAVTEHANGNTTTDGTEQTLSSITSAGNYQLRVSVNNVVNDDEVEVRAKVYPRADASAVETLYLIPVKHDVGELSVIELPWIAIPASSQLDFTLKRVAGTDRAYQWCVLTQ
ncbi:MAG: hypothetical protein IT318_23770 [Anaerolineales bacterium]|nr:hypothetical protein [Anaerolineales bacterium]